MLHVPIGELTRLHTAASIFPYFMIVVNAIEAMPQMDRPIHLAIGMFDGVHIGHQSVIEACINTARNSGGIAAVLTFWPHPSKVLRPEAAVPQIMPLESKLWTLERKHIDCTVVQSFQDSFAELKASDFLSYLKQYMPALSTLFVGENFRFGKGRAGDVNLLRKCAKVEGVHVVSMEQCRYDGEPVSSTRIRNLLQEQRFNEIRFLLGHPYTVRGKTTPGRKVGRSIGFPTLNIDWAPELKPPYGVYAVRLYHCSPGSECPIAPSMPGVANYGIRPTYDVGTDPVLEVHLLNPAQIDYGTQVAVEWMEYLRPEKKFEDSDALVAQIHEDVQRARNALRL